MILEFHNGIGVLWRNVNPNSKWKDFLVAKLKKIFENMIKTSDIQVNQSQRRYETVLLILTKKVRNYGRTGKNCKWAKLFQMK